MRRSVMLDTFEGATVHIPKDWTPTAENINALPVPLRLYIHDLQTSCDPAGTIRENVLLKDENYAMRLKLAELLAGESEAAS
jgi:hypothetical protein